MASIEAALADARAGRGATLFLMGEAGLGKTTMLQAARGLAGSRFAVGSGLGDASEATLPFGIFSQALDDLGTRGMLRTDSNPQLSSVDARAAHFYAVLRFLESQTAAPVALLLDDLHWADPDSLMLLSFLARRIGPLPVAIIGSLRPWPPAARDAAQGLVAAGEAGLERLPPLSESAARALLEEVVGTHPPENVIENAPALTAGNPLLIELTAQLVKQGLPVPQPGAQTATFETALLLGRFAGGTPAEQRYAEAASIFGTSFRPSLAAQLANLSSAEADAALEGLCGSGVLRSTPGEAAVFTHPLLRQALYDRVPPPLRSRKHAAAFRLLLDHGAEVGETVEHAMRGDLAGDSDAILLLEQAGRAAQVTGALSRAAERFEAATRLAGSRGSAQLFLAQATVLLLLGDAPAAARACRRLLAEASIPDADRVEARRLLARALFVAGDPSSALREFQLAVDASTLKASTESAVETLLEAVYVSWPTGGPALAMPLAERARSLAQQTSDDLRHRAETAWAFCAFVAGDPQGVATITEAARRAEADPMSDLGDFAWTWGALGLHGNVAKWTERFDEAEQAFKVGIATAERLHLPVAVASLAVMHGDTLMRVGRLEESLRWLDRASALADLAPERAFWAAVAHGYILIEMGRLDEAQSWAQSARTLADPAESWPGWLWLWHVDAQLAMRAHEDAEACTLFERIEALADRCGVLEPCVVPWMGDALQAYGRTLRFDDAARVLARLEASVATLPCRIPRVVIALAHAKRAELMQERRQTDAAYARALSLSREVGARPLIARVLVQYGTHLRRSGEGAAARQPFREAAELAESAGIEWLANLADQELNRVEGRRRRRSRDPDALTPAESRVASLSAEGLRPSAIEARLRISVNTVETHLQHVYRKLGIKSQLQLMRLASQGQLAVAGGRAPSAVAVQKPTGTEAETNRSSTPTR